MPLKVNILIADDDKSVLDTLTQLLESEGYEITQARDGREAIELFAESFSSGRLYDLVILDLFMPNKDGLEALKEIKEIHPDSIVIVITAQATVESAVQAMKSGAYDYLWKPVSLEQILIVVEKALKHKSLIEENKYLEESLRKRYDFSNIIAKSKKMLEIFELIKRVAPTKTTVLIQGESGTGKELVAKAIHFNSPRQNFRFIPINCGGLPETLLESELFGHLKGSFTGAIANKAGLFEVANGGTLFLDEITTMPLTTQVKLLRVIQDGIFFPIGGTEPIKVDVRLIAASNKNVEDAVGDKTFREDLYYRLNVIKISLPPLRERREDIPLLAGHFLSQLRQKMNKEIKGFSPEATEFLMRHPWHGNVRELENAIEHAVTLSTGDWLLQKDFPKIEIEETIKHPDSISLPLREAKQEFEKNYIKELLNITDGNITKAAKMAKIARQNLQMKISSLRIDTTEFLRKKFYH